MSMIPPHHPLPDDAADAFRALRAALESRGHAVSSDTAGMKRDLYLAGDGDRVRMLFEMKASAAHAADSMYQGRWTETMPPRVAVYPEAGDCAAEAEMLEQAGIERLTYRLANGGSGFEFPGLEELLERLG